MGNLNVTGEALARLKLLAKEDDRQDSAQIQHLIHKEFRTRRNLKSGE